MKRTICFLLAALLLLGSLALCETGADITNRCSRRWPQDKESLYIDFRGEDAGYVYLEWREKDRPAVIVQYDAQSRPLVSFLSSGYYSETLELCEGAAALEVIYPKGWLYVLSYKVYSRGELPAEAQNWQETYEKCDLMLISTHQDDEWLWFGGMIPYYELLRGKRVTVVYMVGCGRLRYGEALAGLWAGGLTHMPVFLGNPNYIPTDYAQAAALWGGEKAIVSSLVEVIRKYRPEVVVTHGIDGEYGHLQHILTSQTVETAVASAADAEAMPESAEKYGAWQVKKFYRHQEAENAVTMDWTLPVPERDGATLFDIAAAAFGKHESQVPYFTITNGGQYDNRVFELIYSAVGEDVQKNDLFENVE